MEMVPLKPERKAQLDEYARRHGQAPPDALDDVLADHLEWDDRDYRETVEAIRRGYAHYKAGRTRPLAEVFDDLRKNMAFRVEPTAVDRRPRSPYPEGVMEVHFTPDTQARLEQLKAETGRSTDELVEDAMAGYFDEMAQVRQTLDSRYDDIKSGRVKPIPGDTVEAELRQRIAERRSPRS
jgi:predicted transcriptional regulator